MGSVLTNNGRGVMLIVVISIFWTLALLAVVLRIWARYLKKAAYVLNDYSIFMAMIFATALVGIIFSAILKGGMGQHASQVPISSVILMSKIIIAGQPVWAAGNLCIKISILHLYNTLFWTRTFRIISYSVMGLAVCLSLIITLEAVFICRPIAFNWDKTIPDGKCGDNIAAFLSQTAINIAIDIAIFILPLPSLWSLQMPFAKKFGIWIMFSVGAGICVITGVRIKAVLDLDFMDITYSSANLALFNALETTLGIINTCLPVLRPVMQKISSPGMFEWTTAWTNNTTNGSRRWYETSSVRDPKSQGERFNRIDDQLYPLNEYAPESSVQIGRQSQNSSEEGYNVNPRRERSQENIRVTQVFQVDSRPR